MPVRQSPPFTPSRRRSPYGCGTSALHTPDSPSTQSSLATSPPSRNYSPAENSRTAGCALPLPRLKATGSAALHLRLGVLDLLVDGHMFRDPVEILDADVARRARGAGRVVGPDTGRNAPALLVPLRP